MKDCLKLLFFLCALFFVSFSTLDAKLYKKHYVDSQSVKITSKGIFVIKNEKQIPVKKLFTDKSGKVYYKDFYKAKKVTLVPCPKCGTWFGSRCCPSCNWPCNKKK